MVGEEKRRRVECEEMEGRVGKEEGEEIEGCGGREREWRILSIKDSPKIFC